MYVLTFVTSHKWGLLLFFVLFLSGSLEHFFTLPTWQPCVKCKHRKEGDDSDSDAGTVTVTVILPWPDFCSCSKVNANQVPLSNE